MNFEIHASDLVGNPAPRLPVGLVLDVSGSMHEEPLKELNRGVQAFDEAVSAHELAKRSAEVAVFAFAETARVIQDFRPVNTEPLPQLSLAPDCGGTSLGAGVGLALDHVEDRKQSYKSAGVEYYQPMLCVITDGHPTDDTHLQVAPRIAGLVEKKRLTIFAIGVGPEADLDALSVISPKREPVRLKGLRFVDFFEFLARSVSQVSSSQPGDSVPLDTTGMSTWAEI